MASAPKRFWAEFIDPGDIPDTMKYVYKFIFESEQRDNFGGNLFVSDFGRAKRDA